MASQAYSKPADHTSVERSEAIVVQSPRVTLRGSEILSDPHFLANWDALASNASEPNPFYESWYLAPSIEQFGSENDIRLLCVERDDELLGLLPLVKPRDYYGYSLPHWRNWVHANCFCGLPLIAQGTETTAWQTILDWCDGQGGWPMFLHLTHIPGDCKPTRALTEICKSGRNAFCVKSEQRALLESELDPEAYLAASMTKKRRKEMARQGRRLAEQGNLQFARQTDASNLSDWINEFLALESSGWKGEAQSALAANMSTATIFRSALAGAARSGKLERLSLSLDGKPIAMLANFLTPPGAFSYKTAFDESYARYSPGVLLQRENLDLLNRDDIAWCDSCAEEGHPMIDRIWQERRTILRLNLAIGGSARRTVFRQIARLEGGSRIRSE